MPQRKYTVPSPWTAIAVAAPVDRTRDGLTSVTRGALVMILGTIGAVAIKFVSRVLLIRILTEPEWGTYSLGLTLAGVLGALATLGLPQAVARNLAFVPSDADRRAIIRAAFRFVIPAAVVVGAVLFLFTVPLGTTYHNPQLALTLQFFSAAVAMTVVAQVIVSVFQGFEDARPNALFLQVLNPILFIAFLYGGERLLPMSEQYVGALAAYLLAAGTVLLGLTLYGRRRLRRMLPTGPASPGYSRRLLVFALPLLITGLLVSVSSSADTIILGYFRGSIEVGYYTATLSLARLLSVGLASVGYIFLPVAARFLGQHDPDSLRLTYATATKWTIIVSLPLFIVFFFLPASSLGFVYGSAYAGTVTPLRIVVGGACVATLFGPASAAQIAFGQTRLVLYNTVAAAAVDVALAAVLVPAFGATGAAIAWAVQMVMFPLLSTVELGALERLHPFERNYLVPLFATAVPMAFVFAFLPSAPPAWALPLLAVGIAFLFGFVVLVTRSIDRGDRLLLEVVEILLARRLPVVRPLSRFLLRGPVKPG